jgi:hypothetical protein
MIHVDVHRPELCADHAPPEAREIRISVRLPSEVVQPHIAFGRLDLTYLARQVIVSVDQWNLIENPANALLSRFLGPRCGGGGEEQSAGGESEQGDGEWVMLPRVMLRWVTLHGFHFRSGASGLISADVCHHARIIEVPG